MEKELYKNHCINRLSNNIDNYFDYISNNDLYQFVELKNLINQNIECLLLNNHIASICVTNHLLERFIKLTIIKYFTLNKNYSNPDVYNKSLIDAYKYDSQTLYSTLTKLKEISLINESEFDFLTNLKDKYRNPYSHADTKSIIGSVPKLIKGRMYSLEDVMKAILSNNFSDFPYKETNISTDSPPLAQMSIENQAEKNGFLYFKEVYDFILKIDKRLQELEK